MADTKWITHAMVRNELLGVSLHSSLDVSDSSTILPTLIDNAQKLVIDSTGRDFTPGGVEYTEIIDGGKDYFIPAHTPIISVTSVTVDEDLLDADNYYVYQFKIDFAETLTSTSVLASGKRNVEIVYKAGYAAVPDAIKQAAAQLVAREILVADGSAKSGGATEVTITGVTTLKFGAARGQLHEARITGLESAINRALSRYRAPQIGVV